MRSILSRDNTSILPRPSSCLFLHATHLEHRVVNIRASDFIFQFRCKLFHRCYSNNVFCHSIASIQIQLFAPCLFVSSITTCQRLPPTFFPNGIDFWRSQESPTQSPRQSTSCCPEKSRRAWAETPLVLEESQGCWRSQEMADAEWSGTSARACFE